MKIYSQKDGRKFIVYKGEDNKYHSKSYARYLMEQHLGRELKADEDVHHIDGDKTHDIIDNLEIKDRIKHRREHQVKPIEIQFCFICGKEIKVNSVKRGNHFHKKNKNPDKWFCSRHCSGIFGQQQSIKKQNK